MKKISEFLSEFFIFGGKIFSIFEWACFRNGTVERVKVEVSIRHIWVNHYNSRTVRNMYSWYTYRHV